MIIRCCLMCFLFIGCLISKLSAYELSIAAVFRDEGAYLKEWMEYHRMVGVEHFWLYNDSSTDEYLTILKPYIEEGIVELVDWTIPNVGLFGALQAEIYRDALKKAKGKSKWLALIDIDEFLLPAKEKTVPECLDKHFSDAAAVYVNWHNFGTSGLTIPHGEPTLFRFSKAANRLHPANCSGKSIVRPEKVSIDEVWYPHHFVLQSGYHYCNGDAQVLSFDGLDLKLDGKIHDQFLWINHYHHRDEVFFKNVRFIRAKRFGSTDEIVWEQYYAFNDILDLNIMRFIIQNYPEHYSKIWKKLNSFKYLERE